jgi:hypothetical protein
MSMNRRFSGVCIGTIEAAGVYNKIERSVGGVKKSTKSQTSKSSFSSWLENYETSRRFTVA